MRALLLLATLFCLSTAFAHPEDEFCVPGEDSLDPALCEALAELDRAADGSAQTSLSPIRDESGVVRSTLSTTVLYVTIGVAHILPDGVDHILFVLAILLASVRFKALLLQISAFTVAHTMTLALAASGVIAPAANIVEPLIALTIAFVAIENIFFHDMKKWRPGIVFAFGLIHGLGFAGFFAELGLPRDQFWSALIGFNIGVEIGQLAIVVVGLLLGYLLRYALRDNAGTRQYRRFVVLPGSVVIGAIGLWWTAERLLA